MLVMLVKNYSHSLQTPGFKSGWLNLKAKKNKTVNAKHFSFHLPNSRELFRKLPRPHLSTYLLPTQRRGQLTPERSHI